MLSTGIPKPPKILFPPSQFSRQQTIAHHRPQELFPRRKAPQPLAFDFGCCFISAYLNLIPLLLCGLSNLRWRTCFRLGFMLLMLPFFLLFFRVDFEEERKRMLQMICNLQCSHFSQVSGRRVRVWGCLMLLFPLFFLGPLCKGEKTSQVLTRRWLREFHLRQVSWNGLRVCGANRKRKNTRVYVQERDLSRFYAGFFWARLWNPFLCLAEGWHQTAEFRGSSSWRASEGWVGIKMQQLKLSCNVLDGPQNWLKRSVCGVWTFQEYLYKQICNQANWFHSYI